MYAQAHSKSVSSVQSVCQPLRFERQSGPSSTGWWFASEWEADAGEDLSEQVISGSWRRRGRHVWHHPGVQDASPGLWHQLGGKLWRSKGEVDHIHTHTVLHTDTSWYKWPNCYMGFHLKPLYDIWEYWKPHCFGRQQSMHQFFTRAFKRCLVRTFHKNVRS